MSGMEDGQIFHLSVRTRAVVKARVLLFLPCYHKYYWILEISVIQGSVNCSSMQRLVGEPSQGEGHLKLHQRDDIAACLDIQHTTMGH